MINPFFLLVLIGFVLSLLHVYFLKESTSYERLKVIFLYQVFFVIGINSLLAFYAHFFWGPDTARYIGWLPHNPFQQEVAFANLAIAILGLLAPFMGFQFWLATLLALTVWYWGDAYVHYIDYQQNGNVAPGNAGLPYYIDIFLPIFFICFIGVLYTFFSSQVKKHDSI